MFWAKNRIYCDAASTTPIDKEVLFLMRKTEKLFANPGSVYMEGLNAKKILENAREQVARVLSVRAHEIIFTSGGTESNNLAIRGVVNKLKQNKVPFREINIVTSQIEHSSVLETCDALLLDGIKTIKVPVNEKGVISLEKLKESIDSKKVVVSIMYVNNEVGTVEPLREISKIVKIEKEDREKNGNKLPIYFHSDASQAPLSENLTAETLGVDLMTLDGHKIYGPKGVGALFVKRNVQIAPIIFGGGQERGLRSTTENLPSISGFSKALEMASKNRENFRKKLNDVKNIFIRETTKNIPDLQVNSNENGVPHIVNLSIKGQGAELFVLKLEKNGVLCSTKSSCMKDSEESYVIYAMHNDHSRAKESIRFSFLRNTTIKQAKWVALVVIKVAHSNKII